MRAGTDIRPSPIAGQWYPGDSQVLAKSVDGYLEAAKPTDIPGEIIAVVVPHAGHRYSGPVAGYAFQALRSISPAVVAVIAPMHYPTQHPLLSTSHRAYQTPLGSIPVHREGLADLDQRLRTQLGFGLVMVSRDPEHAVEIELPFLQRIYPAGFRLLPVMVHASTVHIAQGLGQALAETLRDRQGVLVASTDLSHFYPQSMAERLDAFILERIEALDPPGVLQAETEGKGFACGRGALAAVLWAAQALGADQAKVLRYATSGDVTGDYSQVVGYAAVALYRRGLS